jgi:hypothetical protein
MLPPSSGMRSSFYMAPMMEAAHTSETSVDSYFTRQYIPEDKSELHPNMLHKYMEDCIHLKIGLKQEQSGEESHDEV